MEPMDGIELTKLIRRDPASPNRLAPIILVTGFSAVGRVGVARDAGITEFMVKPFSANDLAKRLAYVINKPRDFIDAPAYFGPDRRRRKNPDYPGPYRRDEDSTEEADTPAKGKATRIRQHPPSG
jgi:DNA-binding response OmpR family regulator